MITVDKLMTRHLVNIQTGTSAIEAAKLMKDHKVGSVFVTQDHRIVGIVTPGEGKDSSACPRCRPGYHDRSQRD